MGQQLNKIIKRRRRKAYTARKKALVKAGAGRKPIIKSIAKAAKKVAKKPAAKKAAAVKPVEVAAPEVIAEVAAPVVEVAAPAAEEAAVAAE